MVVSWSAVFLAAPSRSQSEAPVTTLDQVVASVGGVPVTQRDVQQEYQIETLLSAGQAPAAPASASVMASVQSRVIDQTLLAQALEGYRFDQKAIDNQAAERMADLRRKFKDGVAFQAAIHKLGMSEQELMDRFKEQSKIMEMTSQQLRPSAAVGAQEIESYYQQTFLPDYVRAGKGAPPALKDVQNEIREILTQKNINQLLDQWLAELKKDHPVEILSH
ncbi:MAG: hypothetical protein ACRD1I_01495 [Terriglobia bacterium]